MDPQTDVDDILHALGKWGRYQKLQILLICFGMFAAAFQLLSGVITGYRPSYMCQNPYSNDSGLENTTSFTNIQVDKCHITMVTNNSNSTSTTKETCPTGYEYSIPRDRSFVTEWDLVCEGSERAEFSQTLVMGGQMFGAAFFTSFSDRFGRKTINILSNFGFLCIGLGIAYAPTYTIFAVLRFCIGAFQQGAVMTNSILLLEIVPQENRFHAEIISVFGWTTGVCILSLIGYLMREISWRTIQIVISVYSCYSLIQFWLQEESIRWLLINNKIDRAEKVIKKAAKLNNVNYEEITKKISQKSKLTSTIAHITDNYELVDTETKQQSTDTVSTHGDYKVQRYNATHIFRDRRIFINSLILWIAWVTVSMSYFALTLTSTSLAGDRYLNFFLISVVEYPSIVFELLLLNRIGRKRTVIMFLLMGGTSITAATLCKYFADGRSSMTTLSLVFTLVGKMASAGAFSTVFLYTPEMYPTNLRNVGIGLASSFGRVGAMIAPFAGVLSTYVSWAPGAIVSGMCILVSFLCLFLPETVGYELPSTMEELKEWYKDHKSAPKWNRKTNTQNGNKKHTEDSTAVNTNENQ